MAAQEKTRQLQKLGMDSDVDPVEEDAKRVRGRTGRGGGLRVVRANSDSHSGLKPWGRAMSTFETGDTCVAGSWGVLGWGGVLPP